MQVLGTIGGAGVAWGTLEALGLVPDVREHTKPFSPPQQSDFHLQGRVNGTTVLVLGGGDAGLVAMYELEKAGYRCELLEARDRPGGRAWTVRGGDTNTDRQGIEQIAGFTEGQYMNAGPARIPQHHTTLDYCRELGRAHRGLRQCQPRRVRPARRGRGRVGPADRRCGTPAGRQGRPRRLRR